MTDREQQIMELLRQDPMLPQGEIARRLGITRSSVGVHLANLSKKGYILGKGYVLAEQTERYVVGIGAANVDLMGRSREPLVMEDSNPGFISMSVGGVTHNICENAARMGRGGQVGHGHRGRCLRRKDPAGMRGRGYRHLQFHGGGGGELVHLPLAARRERRDVAGHVRYAGAAKAERGVSQGQAQAAARGERHRHGRGPAAGGAGLCGRPPTAAISRCSRTR